MKVYFEHFSEILLQINVRQGLFSAILSVLLKMNVREGLFLAIF